MLKIWISYEEYKKVEQEVHQIDATSGFHDAEVFFIKYLSGNILRNRRHFSLKNSDLVLVEHDALGQWFFGKGQIVEIFGSAGQIANSKVFIV